MEPTQSEVKGIDDAMAAGIDPAVLVGSDAERFFDGVEKVARIDRRTQTQQSWENPVPLSEFKLDPFPTEHLPHWLRDFVRELAAWTQTPLELAWSMSLAALSTCVARAFRLEIKPGYSTPLNIWVCASLESGNRKSAVVNACFEPLRTWEKSVQDQMDVTIKAEFSRRKSEETYISSLRQKLGRIKDEGERKAQVGRIAELERNLPEVPEPLTLWTSDVTPEKLGVLMYQHHERMALVSDEAGIFEQMAGRYSGGIPNLDLFLKSHDGSPERVDRTGRASVYLNSPALTIGISPQPSVLPEVAKVPGFRGRGLLARFFYLQPESLMGFRTDDPAPMRPQTLEAFHSHVKALLNFAYTDDHLDLRPARELRLSSTALQLWKQFYQENEIQLREDGYLASIKDWGSKLPGGLGRIAGLLHCANLSPREPSDFEVSGDTMASALETGEVLIAHAQAAFGQMGADPELESAKHVWKWIRRRGLTQFSERDCHHGLQSRFRRVDDLRPALQALVERQYIREAPREATPHRPSRVYLLNPALHPSLERRAPEA